jgi:CubicO group peptidase (beta-lactamase class C family)
MNEASSTSRSRTAWRWPALLLAAVLVAAGLAEAWLARRGPAVPGKHWGRMSPRHAGFSRDKLVELAWKAGGTGCIVKGGRMVFEWGDTAAVNDAASSTKPFYTYLAFKAIETGRLASLDDRAAEWLPELGELNAGLGYKDRGITFHHLLSQTSGYGLEEGPGKTFAYNDYNTGLLSWILFHRVYGAERGKDDEVINGEELGKLIGFEHAPTMMHHQSRPRRLRISARDQARFMLLMLRGGRWGDRPILREDLVEQMMAYSIPPDLPRTSGAGAEHLEEVESFGGGLNLKNHLGCLGYYWWFNHVAPDGKRLLPDAPPGTFMGSGYGGRFVMMAIPEEDLVVVWQDIYDGENWSPLSEHGRFKVSEVLEELLDARTGAAR